jgi:HlyD family secretion protein
MKKIWTSSWGFVKVHKKTSIAAAIILIGGFWYYHSTQTVTATTYTVKPATLGTVETTVSGTGQVSSSQELAIDPQVSGTVLTVNVKNGDTVTKGQVLATLDNTNAYYSLENAKIALEKLQTSSPISMTSDQNTLTNSQTSFTQAYQNAFGTISSAYNGMGPVITGLNDLFYGKDASPYFSDTNVASYGSTATGYKQSAGLLVDQATQEYNTFQQTYLSTSISSTTSIDASLSQEITIAQNLSSALKNTSLAINYIISQTPKANRTTAMTSDQNNISNWLSTADQDSSNLSSAETSVQSGGQSLVQAQSNLSADQTTNDPLALQSAELSLQEAQTTYDNYTVTAPFSGIIGNVTLQPGDNAGPSTAIGTIVTKQYQSTIVLNEVNVAKVSVGQPVNVTFNALPTLTATGTVTDVDSVGTVSQGVVSYNVVISFSTDNPEVKAGMSINANIITAEADSVLVVPNSAVKTINRISYIQIPAGTVTAAAATGGTGTYSGRVRGGGGGFGSSTLGSSTRVYAGGYNSNGSTTRTGTVSMGGTVTSVTSKMVQIGLSDNTNTQIISGLNPGDLVVTQTISGTAVKTTTSSASILSGLGGGGGTRAGGGGGGFTRGAGG